MTIPTKWRERLAASGLNPDLMTDTWADEALAGAGSLDLQVMALRYKGVTPEAHFKDFALTQQFYDKIGMTADQYEDASETFLTEDVRAVEERLAKLEGS